MSPRDFACHQPTTLQEALDLLSALNGRARIVSGGQSLLPLFFRRRIRCHSFVDLSRVAGLDTVLEEPAAVTVGAMCRLSMLERSAGLLAGNPLLAATLPRLGPAPVRARATVGGSLAFADPAGELLAVAVAQDWQLRVASRAGVRNVPARALVTAAHRTVLRRDEVIVSATWPKNTGETWGFAEWRVSRSTRPVAGVIAVVKHDGTRVESARVVGFAATPPRRLERVESCLTGERIADGLVELAMREAFDGTAAARGGRGSWRNGTMRTLACRAIQSAVAGAAFSGGVCHGPA